MKSTKSKNQKIPTYITYIIISSIYKQGREMSKLPDIGQAVTRSGKSDSTS